MAKAFAARTMLEDVVAVVLAALESGRPPTRRKRVGKETS